MTYSVIIPAFNGAATISAAIQSILAQTILPQDIIVVDDGSTDETGKVASTCSPLVRVVRQENSGVGSATTRGICETKTALLAFLDADDIWRPGKIEAQLAHLQNNPSCQGVFTYWQTFCGESSDENPGSRSPGWTRSTLMMRTEAARSVGPVIDPAGDRGDMIDWISRGREMGIRMDMLNDVLAFRRIRPGSLSYGRDREKDKGYAHVAWLALQRRKARES